ncbi:6-phosphogluconolactonase [Gordonia hydrophobica]|uniref:6-phosphogluconolactonase n=1 Tax=Gordonia hydrophobica TaxID=40516 RepID=A0ABZ2U0D9_9ACTN|nr:6-phosphogluconolactonase [Gordonia hydrophobica]MBM7369126.1 6-phosphogluconolactonase [Gordonia hydrophobica]
MTDRTERLIFDSASELVSTAAARFAATVATAQRERGLATVALTGGSNGIALLRALAVDSGAVDWSRIEIYWGDERFVPADDPERNELQAREALLDHVAVDPARVHAIPASDGAFGDDIDAAMRDYRRLVCHDTVFDVHLLGMGGEGHVNSLFPHTDATAEDDLTVVAVTDSPKPPPRRITLTFPVINASREVWFLVSGAEKAEAVAAAAAAASRHDWPCAGAQGTERTVWFLDRSAAADLPLS